MRHSGRRDRRRRATCALAVAAYLSLALPAAGNAAPLSGARQLLQTALTDARARGSVHETLSTAIGAERATYSDDVATRSGRQAITVTDGTSAVVLVVGGEAFISGNELAMTRLFGLSRGSARTVGKRWVGIPSSSRDYSAVADAVTLSSALAELSPRGHLKMRDGSFGGRAVVEISGRDPRQPAGGSSTLTLYLTRSGRPLPVRATVVDSEGGRTARGTITLGDWGERVQVTPPTYSVPIDAQSAAIPSAPGYSTFAGPHGYPLPVGRPWGQGCKPIRLAAGSGVPGWVFTQIQTVVQQARRAGIDVTLESRQLTWNTKSLFYSDGQSAGTTALVPIFADDGTPPKLSNGQTEHIALGWDAKLDPDGRNEDLTAAQGRLWLRVLAGHPELVRRSIRQLIAMTQGVATPTQGVSGLSDDAPATDRFTPADIAAMGRMSGCARSSGGGIAA